MATVKVFILKDRATGRYDEGQRPGKHPVCTARDYENAVEYTEDDLKSEFPDGLPVGWEAIKVMEFEPSKGKP